MHERRPRRFSARRNRGRWLAETPLEHSFLFLRKDAAADLGHWGLYAALVLWMVAEPHKMGLIFPDGSAMIWLFIFLSGFGAILSLRWFGPFAWDTVRQATGMTIDQYPWYRCLISPTFWNALLIMHVIGIILLFASLWVFADSFGTYFKDGAFIQWLRYFFRHFIDGAFYDGMWD